MSFALTTDQVRRRAKTVTRRTGWAFLKPGTLIQPVVRSQGIRKGEHVEKIGGPIRVLNVRRERLDAMIKEVTYGRAEVALEGFPKPHRLSDPVAFVVFFCDTHACQQWDEITRIEFEYLEGSR